MSKSKAILVGLLTVGLSGISFGQQQKPKPPKAATPAKPAEQAAPAPITAVPPEPTTPETQTVHIIAGRSIVVNVQSRLRRVLVSNPAVLDTTTTSPTQLVVTAKTPGTSSLVLWDETGHSRIFDIFADLDVSGLRDAVQSAYPNNTIQIEADQGRVILSGNVPDKGVADDVLKLTQTYTKDVVNTLIMPQPPAHAQQILLKVRFAEVDRSKISSFGINIISTGATNTIGTISTQQFGAINSNNVGQANSNFQTNDLLNIFLFRPDINLAATIKALENNNVLQILAEPNLLAMNGQPATFLAGGEFPIPVVQGGANVGAVTIQFRPFGVQLNFVANIGLDNVIRLKVAPEVSSLDYANGVTISGFFVPAISTRKTETQIELKDGQSFGIAGLLDNRTTAQYNKIPWIGDIPILGQLFRSHNIQRNNSELLVLVTPQLVDPVNGKLPQLAAPEPPLTFLGLDKFDSKLPSWDANKPKGTPPSGQK